MRFHGGVRNPLNQNRVWPKDKMSVSVCRRMSDDKDKLLLSQLYQDEPLTTV